MMFQKSFIDDPADAIIGRLERIAIDGLIKMDQLLIHTTNSTYRFAVINPDTQQGVLMGGQLGDTPRRAVLLVSLLEEDTSVEELRGLKIGARAIFYLVTHNGMERLMTGTINGLTLIRPAVVNAAAA